MKKQEGNNDRLKMILKSIRDRGGQIHMVEAIQMGISRYTLYSMRDKGILEQVSRGIFRLADLPSFSEPDFVAVALRVPRAVVCLISALAFHEITTAIPHEVAIAIEKGAQTPRISHPPISVHRFSRDTFESGIEQHEIDGVTVRIYCPEKTLADCFKFRNKLGMDVVLESLKLYKERKPFKGDELLKYALICRVEKVMKPYLEAVL